MIAYNRRAPRATDATRAILVTRFWRAPLVEFVGAGALLAVEAPLVLAALPDDEEPDAAGDAELLAAAAATVGRPKPMMPPVPTGPGGALADAPTPASAPAVG